MFSQAKTGKVQFHIGAKNWLNGYQLQLKSK